MKRVICKDVINELEKIKEESAQAKDKLNQIEREATSGASYGMYASSLVGAHVFKLLNRMNVFSDQLDSIVLSVGEFNVSINDLAGSIMEIKKVQSEISDRVNKGRESVTSSIESTQVLDSVYRDLKGSVENLKRRVQAVEGILTTILEIMEQTNLLALNAAIEAARAGEAGRGFAVVAEEVRKLAEKTSQSANQIKDTIETIVRDMEDAFSKTEKMNDVVEAIDKCSVHVNEVFSDITSMIDGLSDMIATQTTAMEEQSQVLNAINDNVRQLKEGFEDVKKTGEDLREIAHENIKVAQNTWGTLRKFYDSLGTNLLQRVVDHSVFMDNVTEVLAGNLDWTPPHYTECALGKWYYSNGLQDVEKLSPEAVQIFKEIEEPHKKYHELGMAAIKAHKEGRDEEAFKLASEMITTSKDIIDRLMKLAKIAFDKEFAQ